MKAIIFTDSVNTCDCCGKTNLKGTYLVVDDNDNEYYYGSTCVKRNLGITQSNLTKQINEDLQLRKNKAKEEYQNSKIKKEYDVALNTKYEYGDDFYINVVKKISDQNIKLKKEILTKYNLTNF